MVFVWPPKSILMIGRYRNAKGFLEPCSGWMRKSLSCPFVLLRQNEMLFLFSGLLFLLILFTSFTVDHTPTSPRAKACGMLVTVIYGYCTVPDQLILAITRLGLAWIPRVPILSVAQPGLPPILSVCSYPNALLNRNKAKMSNTLTHNFGAPFVQAVLSSLVISSAWTSVLCLTLVFMPLSLPVSWSCESHVFNQTNKQAKKLTNKQRSKQIVRRLANNSVFSALPVAFCLIPCLFGSLFTSSLVYFFAFYMFTACFFASWQQRSLSCSEHWRWREGTYTLSLPSPPM